MTQLTRDNIGVHDLGPAGTYPRKHFVNQDGD